MPADWIDSFLAQTETLRSPQTFRLWTGIATIAAALERRVWTVTDAPSPLYPNLYTVLAGAPASGKSIMITVSKNILSNLAWPGGIFLGPDNPTKAAFMHELASSLKVSINGMGVPMYSPMTVLCSEFGVFMSKYDGDFAASLAHIYDNPSSYTSPRVVSKSITIEAPCLNILAAAVPDALNDIIPESAWGQGLTSRILFIYGSTPNGYRNMFERPKKQEMTNLTEEIKRFFEELHGEFEWEIEAQDAIRYWYNEEGREPVPTYNRLVNYIGRRNEHLMKLSMISAVAAGHGLTVTLNDFRRAQRWLFEAEYVMPDVFRAMAQKSDSQLIQDAHYWMYVQYSSVARDLRKPIRESDLWNWFGEKTTSDKIRSLVTMMEKTGRMHRGGFAGDWIPNPLDSTKS